jgi:hypothetical protein
MNTKIIRLGTLVLLATGSAASTSCNVTGDPSQGGIFWSERKAQGRLVERQDHLETIQEKTARTKRRSKETQRRIDALQ